MGESDATAAKIDIARVRAELDAERQAQADEAIKMQRLKMSSDAEIQRLREQENSMRDVHAEEMKLCQKFMDKVSGNGSELSSEMDRLRRGHVAQTDLLLKA